MISSSKGLVRGDYLKHEVHNLGRFISTMKFRPLDWRTSHPYVLVDRIEDITNQELVRQDPKIDRTICVYGYCRGAHLKQNNLIHIPGELAYPIEGEVLAIDMPMTFPDA